MFSAELLGELKVCLNGPQQTVNSRAASTLQKVHTIVSSKEYKSSSESNQDSLLSGIADLSNSAKGASVIEKVAEILLAINEAKFLTLDQKSLKLWLLAAKNVLTKEGLKEAVIQRILHLSQKVFELSDALLAAVLGDWCYLPLICLLRENSSLQQEALSVLCNHRKAVFKQRKGDPRVYPLIKDFVVPQLCKWVEGGKGSQALKVWTMLIQWLGECLQKNVPSVNALLEVIEKPLGSAKPELRCQALEAWRVLIDTLALKPDHLKMAKMLKLVMTPLKRSASSNAQARLELLRTMWHLAMRLEQNLSQVFDQVCLPLLQVVTSFLGEDCSRLPPDKASERTDVQREALFVLVRLLQLKEESEPDFETAVAGLQLPPLAAPVPTSVLGRHMEACEKTCQAAFLFLQQEEQRDVEGLGHLLLHFLIQRVVEAHGDDSTVTVAALLKLIDDAMTGYALSSPLTCAKAIQEVSLMPEKILTSHCYYSGKVGVLHGTPVLTFLKLLIQPSVVTALNSEEKVVSLFKTLLSLGLNGPSWLHFAHATITQLEKCASTDGSAPPPSTEPSSEAVLSVSSQSLAATSMAGPFWLALASALVVCVQNRQEVNQGTNQEPDFTTMVEALGFPATHVLPFASAQTKKAVLRKWAELYQCFACTAALVESATPNNACHEVCQLLYSRLTPALKEDLNYLDTFCNILLIVGEHLPSSIGKNIGGGSPGLSNWGQRPSGQLPMGNLHWFCRLVGWVLEACHAEHSKHITETVLHPKVKQPLMSATGKVIRLTKDLLSSLCGSQVQQEFLRLFVMPLAPFFVLIKTTKVSKVVNSGVGPKLEDLWNVLVAGIQDYYRGLRDTTLLLLLSPLLEATLLHPRWLIRERALQLWKALFAQPSSPLDIPDSLKEVLRKVRPCLLPDVSPEEFTSSSPATQSSQSQDSSLLVPDARPLLTPTKAVLVGFSPLPKGRSSFEKPNCSTPALAVVRSPGSSRPQAKQATAKSKRRSLYDYRSEEFVQIASPVKKSTALTEHQREVFRERRSLPAMYNNLSQSGLDSQDFIICTPALNERCKEAPAAAGSGEARAPVIILDSEDDMRDVENACEGEAGTRAREMEHNSGGRRTPPLQEVDCNSQQPVEVAAEVVVSESEEFESSSQLKQKCEELVVEIKLCRYDTPVPKHVVSPVASPKVHRPKGRLSFARSVDPTLEQATEAAHLDFTDVVPSSQSSLGSGCEETVAEVQKGTVKRKLATRPSKKSRGKAKKAPPAPIGAKRKSPGRPRKVAKPIVSEDSSKDESLRTCESTLSCESQPSGSLHLGGRKRDRLLVASAEEEVQTPLLPRPTKASKLAVAPNLRKGAVAEVVSRCPQSWLGVELEDGVAPFAEDEDDLTLVEETEVDRTLPEDDDEDNAFVEDTEVDCAQVDLTSDSPEGTGNNDTQETVTYAASEPSLRDVEISLVESDVVAMEEDGEQESGVGGLGSRSSAGNRDGSHISPAKGEDSGPTLSQITANSELQLQAIASADVDFLGDAVAPGVLVNETVGFDSTEHNIRATNGRTDTSVHKNASRTVTDISGASICRPYVDSGAAQESEQFSDLRLESVTQSEASSGSEETDAAIAHPTRPEDVTAASAELAPPTLRLPSVSQLRWKQIFPTLTPQQKQRPESAEQAASTVDECKPCRADRESIASTGESKPCQAVEASVPERLSPDLPEDPLGADNGGIAQGSIQYSDLVLEPLSQSEAADESEEADAAMAQASDTTDKVKGARKRKLPCQASPIASRLRAKQMRQSLQAAQEESSSRQQQGCSTGQAAPAEPGSPPGRLGSGRPPWAMSPSLAHSSRSRQMLDAAMRSLVTSPSAVLKRKAAADMRPAGTSNGTDPASPGLNGILKRKSCGVDSPEHSPQRTSRSVSFADPIVHVCEITPRDYWLARPSLYGLKKKDLAEEVLVDSQEPLCPELDACEDPLEKIIPFMTSSVWQRSLQRRLSGLNIRTVRDLAVLTPAQAAQLPIRAPRVATLRSNLQAYLEATQQAPEADNLGAGVDDVGADADGPRLEAVPGVDPATTVASREGEPAKLLEECLLAPPILAEPSVGTEAPKTTAPSEVVMSPVTQLQDTAPTEAVEAGSGALIRETANAAETPTQSDQEVSTSKDLLLQWMPEFLSSLDSEAFKDVFMAISLEAAKRMNKT
ncbi:telomere-associated protein RIF1 isoform X2 [Ixodes scapularis]|uniref:telomere-associated protein RIF1 isoform X2 n=1 Tax=Ixodes scapularis TaxID=6945 RepID=UPI001A9FB3E3|nr:telomere-associated protein RIF1 isoform X2 [Ixodes scapularis]